MIEWNEKLIIQMITYLNEYNRQSTRGEFRKNKRKKIIKCGMSALHYSELLLLYNSKSDTERGIR
jgi:hypothetical protein